jgi:hypothetical protein
MPVAFVEAAPTVIKEPKDVLPPTAAIVTT